MTRVASGAVLVVIAIAAVQFSSPAIFLLIAEAVALLACREYAALARGSGLAIPQAAAIAGTMLTVAAFAPIALQSIFLAPVDTVLMTSFVAIGALTLLSWHGGHDALPGVAASVLPMLYFGLPIGALVAIREMYGPPLIFLLMLTVFGSDTAQYYSGRAFGRRPLAPVISPKKTVEGAVGGFLAGALVLSVGGAWLLPGTTWVFRGLLGTALVALGIAGDLFESMLKRSAGVKDSSALIPGHGGVLDRLDALLFVAPIFYVVLKYI